MQTATSEGAIEAPLRASGEHARLPRELDVLIARRQAGRGRGRRGWLVQRGLLVADVAGLLVAFASVALAFGPGEGEGNALAVAGEYMLFVATLPAWILIAKLHELYDHDEERTDHTTLDDFVGVLHVVTIGVWGLYIGAFATGLADPELSKVAAFWAAAIVLVTLARAGARAVCRRRPAYVQNTIVVGAGDVGQLVARKLEQHPEYGIRMLGFVDAEPRELRDDLTAHEILGTPERLPELVRSHDVDRVVLAFSNDRPEELAPLVGRLKGLHVQVDIVPRLFDVVGPDVIVHSVEGLPLIGLPSPKLLPFSRTFKRLGDVVLASVLLLVTAPLFAFVAWRIRRDSEGPVLFRQERLGLRMRPFTVFKFRTMTVDTDDADHRAFIKQTMDAAAAPASNGIYKLDRAHAVTRIGRWLRKTSLDELPQLINVLRGEMSLVGPRPCLEYETEFFAPDHYERFLVPPGITGLWQVTARAHSTFGEALAMDVAYVRNWSLGLDLRLLLKTPFQVLRQKKRGTA